MRIKVSEIFYSIQGEGSFTGYPFVFLRLGGCNLKCSYCDTKYSFNDYDYMNIEDSLNIIRSYNVKNLLITGGEPLLQEEQILEIIGSLGDFFISIETNGSLSIKNLPANVHIVIDVKTPSSGFGNSFMIDNLKYLKKSDDIKFVVSNRFDFEFSMDFINTYNLYNISKNIIISPNIDTLSPSLLASWILEERNSNIKLGIQLHKFIGFK
ncbi:MAG TPA: radical SAM protein [Spirochaetota bacterium]|nr:radical SAM protein [Spirochaetota bacterium]HOM38514.1 radical SAM protein [Spirochaetota bacterium]HPQ49054.1 radical SAM protein [Spirochaetota bacterium]